MSRYERHRIPSPFQLPITVDPYDHHQSLLQVYNAVAVHEHFGIEHGFHMSLVYDGPMHVSIRKSPLLH